MPELDATKMDNKLITVGFLNVCSLRDKVDEVGRLMSSRGITVFGIAETWLRPSISDGKLAIDITTCFGKTAFILMVEACVSIIMSH